MGIDPVHVFRLSNQSSDVPTHERLGEEEEEGGGGEDWVVDGGSFAIRKDLPRSRNDFRPRYSPGLI